MARTISTKLAVEGEAQYKQAIASCNSELSTLKSGLALVESEFRGNANSMEALTAKGAAFLPVCVFRCRLCQCHCGQEIDWRICQISSQEAYSVVLKEGNGHILSPMELEYLKLCVKLYGTQRFLDKQINSVNKPTIIYKDNQGIISLANNQKSNISLYAF